MFIQPDERVLIMDLYGYNNLDVRELSELRRVGIRTVYAQGAVRWCDILGEGGGLNFAALDAFLDKYFRAGLKVLLPNCYYLPRNKPPEWYHKPGILNYNNPQTADDIDLYTGWLIERYGHEWVQVVNSVAFDGEFPDHDTTTDHHPFEPEVLADWFSGRMQMLEAQHGEVWTMFHNYGRPNYMPAIYDRLARDYPTSKHYRIQFTHFPHGEWQRESVADYARRYGIHHFVGSEYVPGMRENVKSAMSQGVGLLVGPIHPYQHEKRLTPAMLDTIAETIGIMQNA